MGWSIDTARYALKQIFRDEERKFRIVHPQSPQPTVDIHYSMNGKRDISKATKMEIIALFPDDVYVNFVKVEAPDEQFVWDS